MSSHHSRIFRSFVLPLPLSACAGSGRIPARSGLRGSFGFLGFGFTVSSCHLERSREADFGCHAELVEASLRTSAPSLRIFAT